MGRDEKLLALGSRNFFLCPKAAGVVVATAVQSVTTLTSRCSGEADDNGTKKGGLSWLKFMDFLL